MGKYSRLDLDEFSIEIFRSDTNLQDNLLNILRDSLTNTNSQVRLYTLQLFNVSLFLIQNFNFIYIYPNSDYISPGRSFDYIP